VHAIHFQLINKLFDKLYIKLVSDYKIRKFFLSLY